MKTALIILCCLVYVMGVRKQEKCIYLYLPTSYTINPISYNKYWTFIFYSAQDQICRHDTECPTDQCCVHSPFSRTRGARFLLGDFFQHDHGYCRHYRTLNQTCNVLGHDFLNPELHEFYCDCEKGLECRGERIHESNGTIIHENPKCQQTEA